MFRKSKILAPQVILPWVKHLISGKLFKKQCNLIFMIDKSAEIT